MRRWICHGIGLVYGLSFFGYIWYQNVQSGAERDVPAMVCLLCTMAAAGILTGSILEMGCLMFAWKPKACQQHQLRLRWNLMGLYYECAACGRHWLTRRSWRLQRLLGTIAVWFAVSVALTLALPALLKDALGMPVVFACLGICYSVLLIAVPGLANYLAYRRLKDQTPQERLGWMLTRVMLP